nr:MAG TPA: hypothetical protein [Caudoviricetes sp.]
MTVKPYTKFTPKLTPFSPQLIKTYEDLCNPM